MPGQGSGSSASELAAIRADLAAHPEAPSFSTVVVVADAQEIWIRATFDSVLAQVHDRVELCVCDNGSRLSHARSVLADFSRRDDRIKLVQLPERRPAALAAAEAARLASGDFIAFVEPGDVLAPDALFRVVELLREVPTDIVYTDEEIVDEVDEATAWIRKPYWSPDLHRVTPYLGRLCAVRRSLIEAAGEFADDDDWEHDLLLRVTEEAARVEHLPLPLYRRRVASSTPIEHAVTAGAARPGPAVNSPRVTRRPRVCAIVTAWGSGVAAPIVRDLQRSTAIDLDQVLVIGDRPGAMAGVEFIQAEAPASAANDCSERASCDVLAFVEARTRLHPDADPGWLAGMANRALDRKVGAVGCQLRNLDGTLRYGGIAAELSAFGLDAAPMTRLRPDDVPVALCPSNPAVVPAECLVIEAGLFARVGGFNDRQLPTALYDVDLSFRLLDRGLLNIYMPHHSIICAPRIGAPSPDEVAFVWERWWERLIWLESYQPRAAALVRPDRTERAIGAPTTAASSPLDAQNAS